MMDHDAFTATLAEAAAARGMTADQLVAALQPRVSAIADQVLTEEAHQALLDRIATVARAKAAAEAELRELIGRAGAANIPRSDIANASGVTRQWVGYLVREQITRTQSERHTA